MALTVISASRVKSHLVGAQLWVADREQGLESVWKGDAAVAAFGPDGKTFAVGGAGDHDDRDEPPAARNLARLWDASTRRPLGPHLEHPATVQCVAVGPDGRTVATGSGVPKGGQAHGREARLWDATTGTLLVPPMPHRGAVLTVAFSPDGKLLLTGGSDGMARLWDVVTGKPLGLPLVHRGRVVAAAFSADGRTAITGSGDGTARLWDVATGRLLGPPLPHDYEVNFVAFDPDGMGVLTAGAEEPLQRWVTPIPPASGDPERLRLWCEVLTGHELEGDTALAVLSHDAWMHRRRLLRESAGASLP
jgi:WD40 repeat protein